MKSVSFYFIGLVIWAQAHAGNPCLDRAESAYRDIQNFQSMGESAGGTGQPLCAQVMGDAYNCCLNPSSCDKFGQITKVSGDSIVGMGSNTTGSTQSDQAAQTSADNLQAGQICFKGRNSMVHQCNNLSEKGMNLEHQVNVELNDIETCYHLQSASLDLNSVQSSAVGNKGSATDGGG
jgi:hypothetical protein